MKTQLAIQKFLHNRRGRNLKPKSIQWYEEQLRRFDRFCPECGAKTGDIAKRQQER